MIFFFLFWIILTFDLKHFWQESDCHHCIELKCDTKNIKTISNYFSSENDSKTPETETTKNAAYQELKTEENVRTSVIDKIEANDKSEGADDRHPIKKEISHKETDIFAFNENNKMSHEGIKKRKFEADEKNKLDKKNIENKDFVTTEKEICFERREEMKIEDGDRKRNLYGDDDIERNKDSVSTEIIEDLLCPICSLKLNNLTENDKNYHVNRCCNNLDNNNNNNNDNNNNNNDDNNSDFDHKNNNNDNSSNKDQTMKMKTNMKTSTKMDPKVNGTKNKKSPTTKIDAKCSIQNYFHTSPKKI